MTARFLVDANVLSEPIRPKPDPGVLNAFERHAGAIVVPAPAWHEVWYGCSRLRPSRRRTMIEDYLNEVVRPSFPRVAYEETAAEWHAKERARLSAVGLLPPFLDGQIAAIAAVNDLTIVTANREDFTNFEDVRLVDWRKHR